MAVDSEGGIESQPERVHQIDFVIDQMLRGLDRNASVLSELRQRASVVLSASGLIASLFGAEALKGDYSRVLALAAVASTAAGMILCIAVLWRVSDQGRLPTESPDGTLVGGSRDWLVTISSARLRRIARGEVGLDDLVDHLAIARRTNFRTLRRRSRQYIAACCFLLVQLTLWAAVFFERTW